ncbi:MAG: electron transfer flavoprotein subunit beta/FixA family protein [Euryarchaeota archaeon]|nr:electron transfer flavoprotein subunit beta/FixA family protein [Euryarchaeota archaeon]
MAFNYVALVKGVPDFREGVVKFKDDNTLDRGSTPTVLNPNDKFALDACLEMKVKYGGTVHIVSMGPPNYKKVLEEAMTTYGDRAYLLSDRKMGAADTLATAETIAAGVKKIGAESCQAPNGSGQIDLIIAGFKSADGETGQTGPQAAWKLGYSLLTHVVKLEVDEKRRLVRAWRTVYGEIEEVEAPLPAFVVTDPQFKTNYRLATHRLKLLNLQDETMSRAKTIDPVFKVWSAADLQLADEKIGVLGSPTIVKMVEPIPQAPRERTAEVLNGTSDEELNVLVKRITAILEGPATPVTKGGH